jgi:hypothetical protein
VFTEVITMFRRKPDYDKIFASKETIFQHIYGNRNRTEEIIQSREFLEALSSSHNDQMVDAVISSEALNGDIPSLTYMMRLIQLHLEGLDHNVPPAARIDARIQITADMRRYCDIAINSGNKQDPAFYAVTSSIVLYDVLTQGGARPLDGAIPAREKSALLDAMNSIIKHGKIYISTNPTDRDLVLGAKQKVEKMEQMAPIIAQLLTVN